jgi:hypothetical protein
VLAVRHCSGRGIALRFLLRSDVGIGEPSGAANAVLQRHDIIGRLLSMPSACKRASTTQKLTRKFPDTLPTMGRLLVGGLQSGHKGVPVPT